MLSQSLPNTGFVTACTSRVFPEDRSAVTGIEPGAAATLCGSDFRGWGIVAKYLKYILTF